MIHNIQTAHDNSGQRRGFTLMEVVASLAATSLLLAGMASTIYVSSRANDSTKGRVPGLIEGTKATQLVAADVQLAQTFSTRTATDVQFTVADRDGNLTPDTIRYRWSGVSGDPLTVQYNGGTAVPVVNDVRECQFTYQVQTVPKTSTSSSTTPSGQTLLASWTLWPGGGTLQEKEIDTNDWNSECFRLNVPADATNVQVTKVRVWLRKNIAGLGSTTLQLFSAASGTGPLPSTTQIGSTVSISNLGLGSTHAPVDFTLSDAPVTDTASAYNIVLKGTVALTNTKLQAYMWTSAPVDVPVMKYTVNSATWQPAVGAATEKNYDFPFEVWGTYNSTTTNVTTTYRYFVRGVGIKLRVGGDSKSLVATTSSVLNSPEVTSP